jgi:hypothetical protein
MSVVVVDLNESVIGNLRLVDASEAYPFTLDIKQPFAIPHPHLLITSAREWAEANGDTGRIFPQTEASQMEQRWKQGIQQKTHL